MLRTPLNNELPIGFARSLALLLGVLSLGYKALHWMEGSLMELPSTHSGLPYGLFQSQFWLPKAAGELRTEGFFPCSTALHAFLSETDSLSCCYQLNYDYDASGVPVTAIEVRLLSASAYLSSVQYDLGSGWAYQTLVPGRRLLWEHSNGILPSGSLPVFDFCIDNGPYGEPAELEVSWKAGVEEVCSDTLALPCYRCLAPQGEQLDCLDEGGYAYTFGLANLTDYTIHSLRLREPAGQDLIVEDVLDLAGPWPPGTSVGGFSLTIRPEAEGLESLCFEITASRLLADSSALDCCTFTHCLELPLCDRCCTPFDEYEMDVNAGFTVTADCKTSMLTANYERWGACDRVFWNLRNLNTGTGIGGFVDNRTISFSFQDEISYQLCMEVVRRDAGGMNCYGDTTLTVCDTVFFDCPDPPCLDSSLIDWAFDCPPELQLVCGCDNMTYINGCAAMNWSGVLYWSDGPCGEPPVDSIRLELIAFSPDQAELEWFTGGAVDYRYFLVQRRLPGGGWITIGQVDGNTFNFTDNDPASGLNEYRIVGVTWPGKPVFSNTVEAFITGLQPREIQEEGLIWPNPARNKAFLLLPWEGAAELIAYDLQGRVIEKWQLPASRQEVVEIRVDNWPAGLYLLQARGARGESWVSRLLIAP